MSSLNETEWQYSDEKLTQYKLSKQDKRNYSHVSEDASNKTEQNNRAPQLLSFIIFS